MTDENNNWPRVSETLMRSVVELVGFISLPAAILGAVGVFLGWRASSAYLLTFGLNPDWAPATNVVALIVTGWVEVVLILGLIAFCTLSRIAVLRLSEVLLTASLFRLFVASLAITLAMASTIVVRFLSARNDIGFIEYGITFGIFLMTWWILVVLGEHLFGKQSIDLDYVPSKVRGVLSVLFSSRTVIVLVTVAFAIYYCMHFAVWRGTHFGLRDRSENSHLPSVSLVSNTPLGIPSGQPLSGPPSELYEYSNLRLIVRIGDHIFVFRPTERDPTTGATQVYVIPLSNVESLQIRQWYWPTPTPTLTPIPQLTPTAVP